MVSYTYVDEVNSNLICCICRAPFVQPVVTTTCSHTFCRECILRSLERSQTCPVDRSPLTKDDLRPENFLLRNMVDELLVECPHRPAGCQHTCQRQLLSSHINDACPFVEVPCAEDGCAEKVLRRDVGKYVHERIHRKITCADCGLTENALNFESHRADCEEREASCEFCFIILPRSALSEHIGSCPDAVIPCMQQPNGCPWTGPRSTLEAHTKKCRYEAIKGFFSVNNTRMDALKSENDVLKRRVHEMHAVSEGLRRQLDVARQILGPWWKSEDSTTASPGASNDEVDVANNSNSTTPPRRASTNNALRSILAFSPSDASTSTSTSTSAAENEMFDMHFNSDPSSPRTGPNPYLSAYFPPSDDEPLPRPARHIPPESFTQHPFSRSLSSSSTGPALLYPRPIPASNTSSFSSSSNTTSSSIPPLTFTPLSLPTTLSLLHTSITHLASTLDAHARRQDIALATENLRMNEEVGALRAVVHGLRMQVHGLMMERSVQMANSAMHQGHVGGNVGGAGGGAGHGHGPHSVGGTSQHPSLAGALPPTAITKL